jgi:deoxyxylulose-5-phosphate synthase
VRGAISIIAPCAGLIYALVPAVPTMAYSSPTMRRSRPMAIAVACHGSHPAIIRTPIGEVVEAEIQEHQQDGSAGRNVDAAVVNAARMS